MTEDYVSLDLDDARLIAVNALKACGIPLSDAKITADHLISAEVRGYPGHGLRRILGISRLNLGPSQETSNTVLASKSGFMALSANGRLGIAAAHDAVRTACAFARNTGAFVFSLTEYVGTTGSIGVYGTEAADLGCAAILMCNSEFAVAPTGSKKAILGTNPISITLPGSPIQFSADIATAAWSYGMIQDAKDAGASLPPGVVQTEDGLPSMDPNDADNGSQLPMAGHKGYALGLAIELLCGPLIGAKAGRNAVSGGDGFLGILINANSVRDATKVNQDAQALFQEIKQGPAIAGEQIRIPGERSLDSARSGGPIRITASLLQKLQLLGA